MRDVINCDMVGAIILGDNVHYYSKPKTCNGNDSNHIVLVHKTIGLSFVFVICRGCY